MARAWHEGLTPTPTPPRPGLWGGASGKGTWARGEAQADGRDPGMPGIFSLRLPPSKGIRIRPPELKQGGRGCAWVQGPTWLRPLELCSHPIPGGRGAPGAQGCHGRSSPTSHTDPNPVP